MTNVKTVNETTDQAADETTVIIVVDVKGIKRGNNSLKWITTNMDDVRKWVADMEEWGVPVKIQDRTSYKLAYAYMLDQLPAPRKENDYPYYDYHLILLENGKEISWYEYDEKQKLLKEQAQEPEDEQEPVSTLKGWESIAEDEKMALWPSSL